MKIQTYNDLYLEARRRLRAAGVAAHSLETRLILECASGKTREEFLNSRHLFVTDADIIKAVDDMLERRINGEPVAYIVGEWEFYGLPITVDRSVMIPRTDTELLASESIRLLKTLSGQRRCLDLCAGSGCAGLAVAASIPSCRVLLGDNSANALKICRTNMLRNRLSRNVAAIELDALETPPALLGGFDLILSNPPYIPSGDIEALDSSVRDYEPHAALDGGEDGLKFYRAISAKWPVLLKEGGHLAFECGIGQAGAVSDILTECGFTDIKTHLDSQDIKRVVIGKKKIKISGGNSIG